MIQSNVRDEDVQRYLHGLNTRGYDSDEDFSTDDLDEPVLCWTRTLSESTLLANWSLDEEQCFPIYDGRDKPATFLSRFSSRCFPYELGETASTSFRYRWLPFPIVKISPSVHFLATQKSATNTNCQPKTTLATVTATATTRTAALNILATSIAMAVNKTENVAHGDAETANNLTSSSHDNILSTKNNRLTPSMIMGIQPTPIFIGLYEQPYTPQTPDYSATISLIMDRNIHVIKSRNKVANQSVTVIPLLPPLPTRRNGKSSASFNQLFYKDAEILKSTSASSLPSLYDPAEIVSPTTDARSSPPPPPLSFNNNSSNHNSYGKPEIPRYNSNISIFVQDFLEQQSEDWFQQHSAKKSYERMNRYHTCRHDRRDVKEIWLNFGVDTAADDPCCAKKGQRNKRYDANFINAVRQATYETVVSLQEFERERNSEAVLLEAALRDGFHAKSRSGSLQI